MDVKSGDDGTRTRDPLRAKQVLSQLSYVPISRIPLAQGFERFNSLLKPWVVRVSNSDVSQKPPDIFSSGDIKPVLRDVHFGQNPNQGRRIHDFISSARRSERCPQCFSISTVLRAPPLESTLILLGRFPPTKAKASLAASVTFTGSFRAASSTVPPSPISIHTGWKEQGLAKMECQSFDLTPCNSLAKVYYHIVVPAMFAKVGNRNDVPHIALEVSHPGVNPVQTWLPWISCIFFPFHAVHG